MEPILQGLRSSAHYAFLGANVPQSLKALRFVLKDLSVKGIQQIANCVRLESSVQILQVQISFCFMYCCLFCHVVEWPAVYASDWCICQLKYVLSFEPFVRNHLLVNGDSQQPSSVFFLISFLCLLLNLFDTGRVILDYKVILVDSSHPLSLARGLLKKIMLFQENKRMNHENVIHNNLFSENLNLKYCNTI